MVTIRELLTNLKGLLDKYYLRGDGSNLKNSNNAIVKNGVVCTDNDTGKIIPKSKLSTANIENLTDYIQGTEIDGSKIKDNTIVSSKIKDASITNEKLSPTMINATDDLDLDNYKDEGVYYCPSNATATKMSHTPWQISPPSTGNGSGEAFSLIVLRTTGAYARQILLTYPSNNMSIFTRNYTGSWTPASSGTNGWLKISFDGHTHDYISNSTGSVTSDHIKDKTIVNGDIADTTIESGKIKENAITEGKINNGAVTEVKINNNAVTSDKIKDSAVTTDKINNSAVTEVKINNNAVTSYKIKDSAVTTDKINNSAVTEVKINNNAVTTDKIKNSAVTLVKLNSSDVIDTTVGGTNSSGKLITSNAVKNHTHGNINNDGTLLQNNESATYNTNNLPIVADSTSNYKLKKGVVSTTSIGSGAISSLGISQGDTQATVNNKITEKLTHGWKNVTVNTSGQLVDSFVLNNVTYKQYVNGFGMCVITLKSGDGGVSATSSGTEDETSIAFVNPNYIPVDVPNVQVGSQPTPELQATFSYGILHNKGTVLGRIEYNTIQGNTKWRVMLINNSSTSKPSVNGKIVYAYKL